MKIGLRCQTQTTKEGKLVNFVARARRKDEGGKSISHILEHLTEASSMKYLHHGIADKGSLNNSSMTVVGEDYIGRDSASILEFCKLYVLTPYKNYLHRNSKTQKINNARA